MNNWDDLTLEERINSLNRRATDLLCKGDECCCVSVHSWEYMRKLYFQVFMVKSSPKEIFGNDPISDFTTEEDSLFRALNEYNEWFEVYEAEYKKLAQEGFNTEREELIANLPQTD